MGVSLFLPIADAAPCQRPSGLLRFRIGGPIRSGALRWDLWEKQAIRRVLQGRTDTRQDAKALRVFAGRFVLPNMPISGQSGHSIKKKQKTWVFDMRRPSGKVSGLNDMLDWGKRMINMPNHLTAIFLHCKVWIVELLSRTAAYAEYKFFAVRRLFRCYRLCQT